MSYSQAEMIACAAARVLEDGSSVFVGTGLPIIASMLAQRTRAPSLLVVFEAGGVGPIIPTIPISVGDSRTFHRAVMAASMDYVMSCAQQGHVDYGFLGAAQIDPYGNLNTTCIGSHDRPKTRFPGSGGANDLGSLCWRTIVIMRQDTRKFVEKLDWLTTPGYLSGPGSREAAGLPRGTGPYRVVTQLGVMGFDDATKRMTLVSTHPGVSVEDIVANTGFRLILPDKIESTEPPTAEELRLLREELDPNRIVLG